MKHHLKNFEPSYPNPLNLMGDLCLMLGFLGNFSGFLAIFQVLGRKDKKNYGPFLWMAYNCLKARATSRKRFTFYH